MKHALYCVAFAVLFFGGNAFAADSDIEEMKSRLDAMQKRLQQLEQADRNETGVTPPQNTSRQDANAFNPQISVILNGGYRAFSLDPATFAVPGFATGDAAGLGDRGLGINESELNFAANVDNLFYASSTLSLAPAGGVAVEEAYLQTLALPGGMTAKAGRFFSGIGYINEFHPHHDDFIDRSLSSRVFLNGTFAGDGLQLRWLAPTDSYLELGGELLRGDRFPGGGAARRGAGSWALFTKFGGDAGISNSWLAGISYLDTKPVGRSSFDNTGVVSGSFDGSSRLYIADLVWKWAPNGNPYDTNFKFQAELFRQQERGLFAVGANPAADYNGNRRGGYAEAVYQFAHGWDAGIRYSQLFASNRGAAVVAGGLLDTGGYRPKRSTLVLGYANSEFSRFRLQYSRDASRRTVDHQMALQYIMLIGAHGAHQF